MNIIDMEFPENLLSYLSGGPEFKTDIYTDNNATELRNIRWINARNKYQITFDAKNKNQLIELINFFYICRGRAFAFKVRDPIDNYCDNSIIGNGNGTNNNFELIKTYSSNSGNFYYKRRIVLPDKNTLKVYIDNNLMTIDSQYTLNDFGIIVFHTPPALGSIIKASFSFVIPVRFDSDYLSIISDNTGGYNWKNITLIETIST